MGSGGDPQGNGQNTKKLLGSMLRIDIDRKSKKRAYGIPGDNPFTAKSIGSKKAKKFAPEIWAYGLRNPWRYSFDRLGRLIVADVGQNKWEWVHFQPSGSKGGENYGWNYLEGFHEYKVPENVDWSGITFPVVEYSHDEGCSITGGYVYRGVDSPSIDGTYFFSDFSSGKLWGLKKNKNSKWIWTEFLETPFNVSTFGLDERGEIYFADFGKGEIYRIISPKN